VFLSSAAQDTPNPLDLKQGHDPRPACSPSQQQARVLLPFLLVVKCISIVWIVKYLSAGRIIKNLLSVVWIINCFSPFLMIKIFQLA